MFTPTCVVVDAIGNETVKQSYALNGWGIVGCLLIGTYIVRILKEIAAANEGYSMTKQCYEGILQTMPYIIGLGVCYFLNNVLTQVIFCLTVLITCKLAATPLNPLPKWRYEKTGTENYNDILNSIVDALKSFKKEGE